MKNSNRYKALAVAVLGLMLLSACSKTKNSSGGTTATPPAPAASVCLWNPLTNSYTNEQNQACTGGTDTVTCPADGRYVHPNGQAYTCTAGSTINLRNGTNPGGFNTSGCQYWSNYVWPNGTKALYVPVILNNQLVCLRYDLLNQYSYGSSYYNDYDQYYYEPVYSGSGCKTNVNLTAFGYGNVNLCF